MTTVDLYSLLELYIIAQSSFFEKKKNYFIGQWGPR